MNIRWGVLLLFLFLGVSLYTNFDLWNKYVSCYADIMPSKQRQKPVERYRIQFVSSAEAGGIEQGKDQVRAYEAYADSLTEVYGLPPDLLKSICYTESHWRNGERGAAGEIGLCQLKVNTVLKFNPQAAYDSGTKYVVRGSKGVLVEKLQARLGIVVSGEFDYLLEGRVVQYQAEHKLRIDGIVGPLTWKVLFGTDMPGGTSLEERMWSPYQNIQYGAQYLSWLKAKLNTENPMILAAAYNGGDQNMTVRYLRKIEERMY